MAAIAPSSSPLVELPGLCATCEVDRHQRVLSLPSVESALPDGGLPRGAVVELACPRCLGQATSLALHACAAAQREALLRGGKPAWCAWIDPHKTLYAPGVAAHGVTLERLLVVQPPHEAIARIAVRMVASHVFSVLIVDTLGVPGQANDSSLARWINVVRRLAIAAREGDTSVVLLTEKQTEKQRAQGLPVAMRVELEQPKEGRLRVQVAKERRGRVGMSRELVYTRPASSNMARSA